MPTFAHPDGSRIAYDLDRGAGDGARAGFVFCHGFASVRGGEKATLLRARARALGIPFAACDARGHGESDGSLRTFALSDYLADLDLLLLGPLADWRACVLVGSSLGGAAALFRATRDPTRVAGVVAIAPALGFPARFFDALPESERDEWRRTDVRRLRNEWTDAEVGFRFIEDGRRFDSEEVVGGLAVPTLLVHGDADGSVPLKSTLDLRARAARTRPDLLVVGGGDHRLSAEKHRVQAAIEAFARPLLAGPDPA